MTRPGIHELRPTEDVNSLGDRLRADGWMVYVLPVGISDRTTFFDAMKSVLPLDPPVVGTRSWDALADSLWSGIDGLADNRIAIVWPNASAMRKNSKDDFEIAVEILKDVAASLGSVEATDGHPKDVAVFV